MNNNVYFQYIDIGEVKKMSDDTTSRNERDSLVALYIKSHGSRDPRIIKAMQEVPRHLFVPEGLRHLAYEDSPLPIGFKQTISQPSLVAFMTDALHIPPEGKVLEIGTGSGYQAALLSRLCKEVFTLEVVKPLADNAVRIFNELGYANIRVRVQDGYGGWPEEAPFDAILLTAAPDHVPAPLLDQLKVGGTLVMPRGPLLHQDLIRITKTPQGFREENLMPVSFVPMTGKAQE